MRKLEKNSQAKSAARQLFETSELSIREIAREVKVNDKTVRNWIDEGQWLRNSAARSAEVRTADRLGDTASSLSADVSARSAVDIAKDFCGTIDMLRAELDTATRNLRLLQEIAEADVDQDGEKAAAARRRLIAKILDLPALVKAANDLAAALSRLKDVGPGKKDQRQSDAERSASSGRFAAPPPPRRQMQ